MTHFDSLKIYSCGKHCEKLLVTSNFSYSHNVFYPIWHLFFTFMSSTIYFNLDQSKTLSSGNGQGHSHRERWIENIWLVSWTG